MSAAVASSPARRNHSTPSVSLRTASPIWPGLGGDADVSTARSRRRGNAVRAETSAAALVERIRVARGGHHGSSPYNCSISFTARATVGGSSASETSSAFRSMPERVKFMDPQMTNRSVTKRLR